MIEGSITMQSTKNYNQLVNFMLEIPCKFDEVIPGVLWGDCGKLFTPAFWKFQYSLIESGYNKDINYRLGETLLEEIVACLLGGYGIPSEMGMLAFHRLKRLDLIRPKVKLDQLKFALSEPFENTNGKKSKYRFANQKAMYIYLLLQRDDISSIPLQEDSILRNWLLSIDGIGYKTASWITRNWLNSNQVAILDIHIIRAGKLAGFYSDSVDVTRNYLELERRYLDFCNALNVNSSKMDAIIWDVMKKNNRLAINSISAKHY